MTGSFYNVDMATGLQKHFCSVTSSLDAMMIEIQRQKLGHFGKKIGTSTNTHKDPRRTSMTSNSISPGITSTTAISTFNAENCTFNSPGRDQINITYNRNVYLTNQRFNQRCDTTMDLPSGIYTIRNLEHRNWAMLLNADDDGDVVASSASGTIFGEKVSPSI
jgi:hypothetical protein